jgi:hypothetical protein
VACIALTGIDVAIDAVAQDCSTTIGAIGGYAVVLSTTLPAVGVTLTSSYLAAMVGDIAASHLSSVPGGPPIIDQHVLPGDRPGRTHAHACVLDHVAELRDVLDAVHASAALVTVAIADAALERADRIWRAQDQPPPA